MDVKSRGLPPTPRFRRTRFVCIADTHNRPVKLPKGDVLIHAGDMTNQGSYSELRRAVQWLEKTDFEAKIVIAGNHDVTLDRDFYARSGARFHNQSPQDPDRCISILTESPTITYLCHSLASICLTRPGGPRTRFTVFGSPYSPRVGTWAFDYPRADPGVESGHAPPANDRPQSDGPQASVQPPTADSLWSSIPLDTDVVVTHTPPSGHCDRSVTHSRNLGCEHLRRALWRVRPRLHVCGHVHEAHGAERVSWHLGGGRSAYSEDEVRSWDDTARADGKISLVDLTARGGKAALANDGSHRQPGAESDPDAADGYPLLGVGGDPEASSPCDQEALRGRTGRRETCVVNAAIAATSWPHAGGKRFHDPIVVDLDLPSWDTHDSHV